MLVILFPWMNLYFYQFVIMYFKSLEDTIFDLFAIYRLRMVIQQ